MSYNKSKKEEIIFLFNQLRQEDKEYIISLLESIIKMNTEINKGDCLNKTQNSYKIDD